MSLRSCGIGAAFVALFAILLPIHAGCQGTCTSSSDCGSTDYCSIANGVCVTPKSLGFCKPRPDSCAQVISLVCGCDGKTYDNSCAAALQGVSVAGTGTCGAGCGGVTGAKCASGQFCELAVGTCSQSSPAGSCVAPPMTCPDLGSPVCGCDRKTYANPCEAEKAQISLLAMGDCPCGGPDDNACEDGRYCQFAQGACLGPNPVGTCKPIPTSCSPVKSPQCGCDGKLYDNLCEAAKAGISVTGTQKCDVVDAGSDAADDAGDGG